MLPRQERLTSAQFERAFARGQQVRHPLVAVRAHFRDDNDESTRTAFVVPKKQAKKATQRNLIRRRLRERYRLHSRRSHSSLQGCDLIFMATPQTAGASVAQLDAALEEVLRRVGKKMRNSPANNTKAPAHNAIEEESEGFETELPEPYDAPVTAHGSLLATIALELIRFYQRFISPGLPPSCRFEPTCSRYTYASIERFGLVRGSVLGVARVCRCHPWHPGGYDPVPQLFPNLLSKSQNKKKFSTRRFLFKPGNGASE